MSFDRQKYNAVLTELEQKKIQACFEVFIQKSLPSKNPTPLQKMIDEVRSTIPDGHRLLAAAQKAQLQKAELLKTKITDMTGQQVLELSELIFLQTADLIIRMSGGKQ